MDEWMNGRKREQEQEEKKEKKQQTAWWLLKAVDVCKCKGWMIWNRWVIENKKETENETTKKKLNWKCINETLKETRSSHKSNDIIIPAHKHWRSRTAHIMQLHCIGAPEYPDYTKRRKKIYREKKNERMGNKEKKNFVKWKRNKEHGTIGHE